MLRWFTKRITVKKLLRQLELEEKLTLEYIDLWARSARLADLYRAQIVELNKKIERLEFDNDTCRLVINGLKWKVEKV